MLGIFSCLSLPYVSKSYPVRGHDQEALRQRSVSGGLRTSRSLATVPHCGIPPSMKLLAITLITGGTCRTNLFLQEMNHRERCLILSVNRHKTNTLRISSDEKPSRLPYFRFGPHPPTVTAMPVSDERLTGSGHLYPSKKASCHTELSVVVGCGQPGGW